MKCSKCNLNERHGSLSYCQPCHSAYVKALRIAKKAKMDEPVKVFTIEPSDDKEDVQVKSAVQSMDDDRTPDQRAGFILSAYLHKGAYPPPVSLSEIQSRSLR